jgi:RNA polymerase sigma factor (sigma-70 family)
MRTTAREIKLLEQCLKGNSQAFEVIVAKYQELVCAITFSGVTDVQQSEELAHQTFVNAWKNLSQLKDLSRFRPWLCTIARNNIRNFLNKNQRDIIAKTKAMENINDTAADEAGPLESAIKKEHEELVSDAIRRIPEQYREPLVLYYRQQQSLKQVALSLDLSEGAVRQRLHRGRKMIKEQLSSIVEETLSVTGPKKAFTTAVIASIAGMAIKGTGVTAVAGIAAGTSTTGTTTGVAAVMSGVTAKIITAAAVIAIGIGAAVAYKTVKNNDAMVIPSGQTAAIIKQETATDDVTSETPIKTVEGEGVVERQQEIKEDQPPTPAEEAIVKSTVEEKTTEPEKPAKYEFKSKGVLSGMITDKDTGEPVVGAEIVVYGASIPSGKLVTDVNGFYSLEKIKNSKPYMIAINSKDYIGKPDIDDNYKISIEKDKQQIAHFQLEKACIADLWIKDEHGNPIEGAEIKVVDLATNRSTAVSRSNIIKPTDKDGYTLIGGHPASNAGYMVIITHKGRTGNLITSSEGRKYHETKPDFAPAHIIVKNTDPDIVPAFDVTMEKGKLIKGYIEYSDGVPASDLKIVTEPYWWSKTNLSGQRTEVAPDGSFALSNIAPEKYSISAFFPVKGSYKLIKTIDFAQYDGELHFTLSEPSPQTLLSIKGTVKVFKKAPVGNLYIDIHSYNTSTNTHGSGTSIWEYDDNDEAEFEINRLKEGNYRLMFQSEHFKKVVLENIKPPVDDLYIEMEQVVKPEIVAMVVDKATGEPVTNMRARLIKTASRLGSSYVVSEKWLERSNPQGRAVFTVTPGVYQVQIIADGYALGISEEIDTENLKPVTIELTKGGAIKGYVVNSAGKPVAGAEILALSYAGGNRAKNRGEFITKIKSVASDTNGNFVLENLPEGLEAIKADHKDYSPVIVSDIAVVNGKVSEEIIVELKEGAIIEGYVFDNNGNTIAGARMDYDENRERVITGESTNFVITDPNGYYKIEGLGENSYFIARNRGSLTEGVSRRTITPVCGEVTRLDFGGDGHIVMGTVVVGNLPSANIKLALRSNNFDMFLCHTTTDVDGNFVFTGVVKGSYNIKPVYNFKTMFATVDVVDADIDLGVIGNNLIDFEAVIEPHEDWKELQQVAIVSPPTYVLGQQRDAIDKQNRLWRFVNIVPGKYNLRISNDRATIFTVKVDIVKGQTEALKIKPPILNATLTGNFYRSISNKSMPQFLLLNNDAKTVSAYLVPKKDGVPDANGEFEVKLPAGQYQISYTDGKVSTLLKEFEIISGQHMELEIDLDTTLE